ncbi:MAG: hypothetical protein AB7O04_16560 [Hyphomonadaceae bacterium]
MKRALISLCCAAALAACASAPQPTTSRAVGAWSFGYDGATGLYTATQVDEGGRTTARVTCQAPNGDMTITDYVAGVGARGDQQVRFAIGQEAITVPGRSDGRTLTVRLPRRPPNLQAYAHLSREPVTVSVGSRTHAYAEGAVVKFAEVANSCWPQGS